MGPETGIASQENGVNGVNAGDGFLLSGGGSYIERIEMDGRVTCLHRVADYAISTKVNWSGSGGNAIWALSHSAPDFTKASLYWAKLDRDGARITEPIELTTQEDAPLSGASLDDGTLLVVSRGPQLHPSASSAYLPLDAYPVDVTWVDAAGAVVQPSAPLATNGFGTGAAKTSPDGNDIVVGWLGQALLPRDAGPAWLTLARLSR